VRYAGLPPGTYVLRVKGCGSDGVWDDAGATFTVIVRAPFWEQWWFVAAVLTVVCVTFYALWDYRRRIQRQRESARLARQRSEHERERAERERERAEYAQAKTQYENERLEREKQELDRLVAEYQLKTLQLHMNPHFLYNALSPLQLLMKSGNAHEAEQYLEYFTDLLRATIDQSQHPLTTLEREIRFLRAYVAMEQYYTEEKFTLALSPPVMIGGATFASILIPPMVIQPYVENAIRHGLSFLYDYEFARPGKLSVTFRCTERHVFCTIEDNGIGRRLSKERQRGSTRTSLSFSTQRIRQQMELFNQLHQVHITEDYTDLVAPDGTPLGTRVMLHLPLFPHTEQSTGAGSTTSDEMTDYPVVAHLREEFVEAAETAEQEH
jgi:hypothetical protein